MPAMSDYGGIGGDGGDQQQPEQYLSQYEPIPFNGAGNFADGREGGGGTTPADAGSPVLSGGGGLNMLNPPQSASDISSLTLEQQQQLLFQLQEQQRLLQQQLDRKAQEQLSLQQQQQQQQQGGTAQNQSQHLPAAMGGTAGVPAQDLNSVHTPTLSNARSSGGSNNMMNNLGFGVGTMGLQPQQQPQQPTASGLHPEQQQQVHQVQQNQMQMQQMQQLLFLQQQQRQAGGVGSANMGVGGAASMGMAMGTPGVGTAPPGQAQLTNIAVPGLNDVLCGRGGAANNHEGNVRFRKMVAEQKRRYLAAGKKEKPQVARDIVKMWRAQDPPGRFLAQDKDGGGRPAPSTRRGIPNGIQGGARFGHHGRHLISTGVFVSLLLVVTLET